MASPRVGIDATALGAFGKGVARYARELLPELTSADGVVPVVLAPPDAELPPGAESLEVVRVRARPAIRWEQMGIRRVARAADLALVHTTSDRVPLFPGVPVVVYLFEDPKYRLAAARGSRSGKKAFADLLTRMLFPLTLRRAALILVSSEATARDLAERGVPAEKVRLVYPGVAAAFRPGDASELESIRAGLDAPGGYVLHFSSDDPRDNTRVALEAYRLAATELPLLIGGLVGSAHGQQQAWAQELGIADRVRWLGFQSGDALTSLYRGASVYIDPSLYEGFGFQVAEALASGVPVVCSNTTSLPEVVGSAGLTAAPSDAQAFAAHLVAILTDPGRRAELSARAVAQAARFTWACTAQETVAAWLEVAGGPR